MLSSRNTGRSIASRRIPLTLGAVIALGFWLRIIGVDWDHGQYMHPDERHIVFDVAIDRIAFSWPPSTAWLASSGSPIDPRPLDADGDRLGFAYGTLPVYSVDIIGSLAEWITGDSWNRAQGQLMIGRGLSILLDTATIAIVFALGVRIAGRHVGLVGAGLYAFLPLAIQQSHFFTVDAWLTFFLAGALLATMRAVDLGSLGQFAVAGVWFGLSMTTKTAAAPFALVMGLALVLVALRETDAMVPIGQVMRGLSMRALAVAAASVAIFAVGEPFALVNTSAWIDDIRLQALIQSGGADAPFTQQYVGTIPGAYQLDQAVRFGFGPGIALLGIAGAIGLGWLALTRRSAVAALPVVWVGVYLAVILVADSKFLRYLLPIAPVIAVTAALAVVALLGVVASRRRWFATTAMAAGFVTLSAGPGAAYTTVTTEEHPRVTASHWMLERLAPGDRVVYEIWDDMLPLPLDGAWSTELRRIDAFGTNHFEARPNLGDIARIGSALAYLPDGEELAISLRAGHVPTVAEELRGDWDERLAGMNPVEHARFQSELFAAMAGMTSSPDLIRSVDALARDVALDGSVSHDHLVRLADAMQRAWAVSKPLQIHGALGEADAYVRASNRVQNGIEHNPWRYPVPQRMYELLDAGSAGYEPVAAFSAQPTLFGIGWPDDAGDESWLNYDHPAVTVYSDRGLVDADRFVDLLGSTALAQTDPTREPDTEPLTFDSPVSDRDPVDNGRWSEMLTGTSAGAVAAWVLMLVALQAAALPVTMRLFHRFPDRGWGLARLVGILVPATALWWLASFELARFHSAVVVASFALFAIASWRWTGLSWRDVVPHGSWRSPVIAAEIVFWLVFGLFLVFRFINPDSWHMWWGGEKPMEFAQINAILRSATFPPPDPWYAQGIINYYYYGFYLVAWLVKLTGIPLEFAFNLAQPTVIALLASGVFTVGAALARSLGRRGGAAIFGGAVAVLFVSMLGNFRGTAQLLLRLNDDSPIAFPFDFWVFAPSRAITYAITEFPFFTGLYADLHPHVVALPITVLVIALALATATGGTRDGRLVEVSRLALLGVAVGILYPTNAWDLPVYAALAIVSVVIATAGIRHPLEGILGVAWRVLTIAIPAVIVVGPFVAHYEALFVSIQEVRSSTSVLDLGSHLGGQLILLTLVVPFIVSLAARGRQVVPPVVVFVTIASLLTLRWVGVTVWPEIVRPADLAIVVISSAIWIVSLVALARSRPPLDAGLPSSTLYVLVVGAVGAVITALVLDRPVLALWLALAISMAGVFLLRRNAGLRFLAAMIAAASCVGAGLELVFLADDLVGTDYYRMNTVFKFSYPIWLMLGIAVGGTIGAFLPAALAHAGTGRPGVGFLTDRRVDWAVLTSSTLVVVMIFSAGFHVRALPERLNTRFEQTGATLTLDADAWMEYGTVQLTDGTVISYAEDRDVIRWFNEEVPGSPVIAEASLYGPYRCNGSRISNGTGLPTILGWLRHQMQQRDQTLLPPRDRDVRTLYSSTSEEEKLALIHRYDVRYIVLGELERHYPYVAIGSNDCVPMRDASQFRGEDLDAGIAVLESMVGDELEVAFTSGDTVVYRVVGND